MGQDLRLELNLQHFHALQGAERVHLYEFPKEAIVTVVFCVLKPGVIDVAPGKYKVNHQSIDIAVEISEIHSAAEDQILEAGKMLAFGDADLRLPFLAVTDNRGRYPACSVVCIFPYRLSDKASINYQDLAIVGFPPLREKIELISVLRQLCVEQGAKSPPLVYESITTFLERYFRKPERVPFAQKLHALASASAYRDALIDALVDEPEPIKRSLAGLNAKWVNTPITTERILAAVVLSAMDDVLKFQVEDRHWIEPFWDGPRAQSHEGKKFQFPKVPKKETEIQPTLHVVLDLCLSPLGIHLVRESHEGVGTLDFKCLYTTPAGVAISVGIEFKLAHHKKLKHGVHVQLPCYLRSMRSKTGIFAVMWFKNDTGTFAEPSDYTKDDFEKWLEDQVTSASETHGVEISKVLIDASVRPSASKANK